MATVLIIDDDQAIHRLVALQLAADGFEVLSAHEPFDGIRLASSERPDLILLDMNLPGMDGLKVCRHLREREETRDVPILFFTVADNAGHVARALEIGANDYIRKPVDALELRARVRASLRTKRMVDMLRVQARIDALTGLMNRAALDDALVAALAAWDRTGAPMSVMMLDVDHFKQVNDSLGHGIGDDVLRRLGEVIGSTCRPYDSAARFGGDEFAVIFGQTGSEQAAHAARRLMEAISEAGIHVAGEHGKVTVSAGLVSTDDLPGQPAPAPADVVKAADEALYEAKSRGRNRLVIKDA
jgi:diguanylate cyclase (GGDEF)-like protein